MKKTIRLAASLLTAAVLLSCSIFDYSGMVVNKYALVYGVSMYTTDAAGPNLQFPDVDASAMAALLAAQGYTVKSRWVTVGGDIIVDGNLTPAGNVGAPQYNPGFSDPGSLNSSLAPTRTTILQDIQNVAPSLGPNDVLVVYFSGHGTQDAATPAREYFDPYEGVVHFLTAVPPGYYADPSRSIRDDDLRAVFDAIGTPRKVLILDTCNSGGFIGNQLEVDATPSSYKGGLPLVTPGTLVQAISNYSDMQASPTGLSPYGAQVLSAAGKDELSYESSSLGHGVLTYYLLQGLQGSRADLNNDGYVTVLEAFAYAKAGVDQNWNRNAGVVAAQATFEPRVSGGPVDFVLF